MFEVVVVMTMKQIKKQTEMVINFRFLTEWPNLQQSTLKAQQKHLGKRKGGLLVLAEPRNPVVFTKRA